MWKRLSLVLILLLLLAAPLSAADFDGPTSLNPTVAFQNPFPADAAGAVYTGMGTTSITWGDPGTFGTGPSSLTFTPQGNLYSADDHYYILGEFDYFNGTISVGTEITRVDLVVQPDPDPWVEMAQTSWTFPIDIIGTVNIPGDPVASADAISLLDYHGDRHTFWVFEGGSAQVSLEVKFAHGSPYNMGIIGFVDPSPGGFIDGPIPAPGAILLGAIGSAVVGLLRRRGAL